MDQHPRDIMEETVAIPAGGGTLSGVLAYPFGGVPDRAALIVGPHPMMGGRLDNNVVRRLARGMAERGFLSLRYAYGGGGPSPETLSTFWRTGHAPDDPLRADETVAARDFLRETRPLPAVAIGYSFGASLLAHLLDGPEITHLVLIGATLTHHDYRRLSDSPLPKLVIAADDDFATPLATTRQWFERTREPKRLLILESAEHFYRGQEGTIVREIVQWIDP